MYTNLSNSKAFFGLIYLESNQNVIQAVEFEETYKEVDRSGEDVVFIDFSSESLEKSLRNILQMKPTEQ